MAVLPLETSYHPAALSHLLQASTSIVELPTRGGPNQLCQLDEIPYPSEQVDECAEPASTDQISQENFQSGRLHRPCLSTTGRWSKPVTKTFAMYLSSVPRTFARYKPCSTPLRPPKMTKSNLHRPRFGLRPPDDAFVIMSQQTRGIPRNINGLEVTKSGGQTQPFAMFGMRETPA